MQKLGRSSGTSRRSYRRLQTSLAQSLMTCGRSCEHVRPPFEHAKLVNKRERQTEMVEELEQVAVEAQQA
eukprot:6340152-Pyramimonas_sp.AAC.1